MTWIAEKLLMICLPGIFVFGFLHKPKLCMYCVYGVMASIFMFALGTPMGLFAVLMVIFMYEVIKSSNKQ